MFHRGNKVIEVWNDTQVITESSCSIKFIFAWTFPSENTSLSLFDIKCGHIGLGWKISQRHVWTEHKQMYKCLNNEAAHSHFWHDCFPSTPLSLWFGLRSEIFRSASVKDESSESKRWLQCSFELKVGLCYETELYKQPLSPMKTIKVYNHHECFRCSHYWSVLKMIQCIYERNCLRFRRRDLFISLQCLFISCLSSE